MKKIVMRVLITVLIIVLQLHVNAQDDPPNPAGDPDDQIPLDPGSWVLVAAGVGYGVKKWMDSKQKPNKNGVNETAGFIENQNHVNP